MGKPEMERFPVEPGSLFDQYRVVAPLAQGGMGAVVVAEHSALQRRVALKLLRRELTEDKDLLSRFRDEALAVGRIQHEHIVDITDFGTTTEGEPTT
jgi:eukaryotic-like serine/threonine-protein kinase